MLRRDLKDPRLGFITVTNAEISRDLRHARVFVSVLGSEEEREASIAALRRAAGFIRGEFTRRARLRVAPEIDFRHDEGIARGARLLELLHTIELPAGAPDGGAQGGGDGGAQSPPDRDRQPHQP